MAAREVETRRGARPKLDWDAVLRAPVMKENEEKRWTLYGSPGTFAVRKRQLGRREPVRAGLR